jgi:long-chain acyl-CoA synthetase
MQKRTLFRLMRETVQAHPDSIFMTERHAAGWVGASFRQVAEEARRVAGCLLATGLARGDRVTLLAEGRNSWTAAEFGIFLAGGISVPISVKIREKSEISFRMRHSASRFAITSEKYAQKMAELAPELPDLEGIFVMDPVAAAAKVVPWPDVMKRGQAFADAHPEVLAAIEETAEEGDPVTLTYTSGTIAEPKGILLTHLNYWVNVEQADAMFPLVPPMAMLLILPWDHSFGHTAGLFLFLRKASLIAAVEPAATEIGTIRNIPKNMKEIGPTYLLVVPALVENFRRTIATQARQKGMIGSAMFSATIALGTRVNGDAFRKRRDPLSLLAWPPYLLLRRAVSGKIRRSLGGRLVFMVSGGSACSTEHVRWFTALGIPLYQGYGLSETSPIISSNSNLAGNFKIGSSGRPFPWARVSILAEDGTPLPAGQTGEICVSGECVMRGYWRSEAATREAMDGGLFHTGDLGYVDGDGFLFVVGRIKSLLVGSNGEKYSPEALEQHISDTVPFVSQVVLYNQQNPFTVALVVPAMGPVADFMRARGLTGATDGELDQVLEALRRDLLRYRSDPALKSLFVADWTPKTYALLPEAFSESNGTMNAGMKIVRRAIVSRYRNRIEKLYGEEEDPLNPANRTVLRSLLERAVP